MLDIIDISMEKVAFLQHLSSCDEIALVGPMPFSDDIAKETPIIYVDGGLNHKRDEGHIYYSVGDGDSYQGNNVIEDKLPVNKDFTDLAYALSLIPKNIKIISLYGFLGGRIDHQLVNFGVIHRFLESRSATLVLLDKSIMAHSAGDFSFEHQGLFSVITLVEQKIIIEGDCDYKLNTDKTLKPMDGLGISNMANGSISISCSGPIFIYTQFS